MFPCTQCGACCRRIDKAVESISELMDTKPGSPYHFPYQWDASGKCENLTDDNLCRVYDTRPLICNIDAMASMSGLITKKGLKNWYQLNADACNKIMDEDGIDKSKNVVL